MKSPSADHAERGVMRPVRKPNTAYRVREHLTEDEVAKLLTALKIGDHIWVVNREDGVKIDARTNTAIGRAAPKREACDLRWDDIDLAKRNIQIRGDVRGKSAP